MASNEMGPYPWAFRQHQHRENPEMLTSYEFVSAWLQARCKTDRGASLDEQRATG